MKRSVIGFTSSGAFPDMYEALSMATDVFPANHLKSPELTVLLLALTGPM